MSHALLTASEVKEKLARHPMLRAVGEVAAGLAVPAYAVGGFVRDQFLKKRGKDIDFVVEGDGIGFARRFAKAVNARHVAVYKQFGTALVETGRYRLEFVGARRESYRGDSRKPEVTPAELLDDLRRRDFTINAMALSLVSKNYLQLVDPFDGAGDLRRGLLRTPLDPEKTFQDDPLRIMRGIRFAAQLQFAIDERTFEGMRKTASRLEIISQERITEELLKILAARQPSRGFMLMDATGVLALVFPELVELKGVQERQGYFHKDVFEHTLKVMDNLARMSKHVPLRLVALVHDIAKPRTKQFAEGKGWTFHGHEELGARMLGPIFRRMRLPKDWLKYAQKLTRLHLRPIALTEEECTDSAYRRLLVQAGEHLEDLITLCRADITSENPKRRHRHLQNFDFVVRRLKEVEEKDRMRAFQSPVRGQEIMALCGLTPGPLVGRIKQKIEEAILEGTIPNEYEAAKEYLLSLKDEIELEKAQRSPRARR